MMTMWQERHAYLLIEVNKVCFS